MFYIQQIEKEIFDTNNRQYGKTIAIHAPHRRGKTLTMTFLLIRYLNILPYVKGVISNVSYDLTSLGKEDMFRPLSDIKMISKEEYKDYIIITDEFRRICDSRMSSSFRNRFISNLLADTGKFRQIHLLTDQVASSVDKRVRANTDYVLCPFIDLKKKICVVKVFDSYIKYFRSEAYGEIENNPIEFAFDIEPYFKFYDTEQKIDDYFLRFTPDEFVKSFVRWVHKQGYDKIEKFKIKKQTLRLWKEMSEDGLYVSDGQLTAIYEYMLLESEMGRFSVERKD